MTPQMMKVKGAGVISVKNLSETNLVEFPASGSAFARIFRRIVIIEVESIIYLFFIVFKFKIFDK